MCETGQTLKLCTCGEKIDKSKPYWRLSRKKVIQEDMLPIATTTGIYAGPSYDSPKYIEKQIIRQSMQRQMNERCCFDFDYHPFDEDKLVIHLNGRKFKFVYSDAEKKWEEESTHPFVYNKKIKRDVQAKGYVELTQEYKLKELNTEFDSDSF